MSQIEKVKELAKPTDPAAPQNFLDRLVISTPVVMTVVATILAGLSSGEMSTAQYHRALAAQFQSKAGDQWNLFQAKRLRQNSNENILELMEGIASAPPLDPQLLTRAPEQFNTALNRLQETLGNSAPATTSPTTASPTTASPTTTAPTTASPTTTPISIQPEITASPILLSLKSPAAALQSKWTNTLADPKVQQAIQCLTSDRIPAFTEEKTDSPAIAALLSAIDSNQSEEETIDLTRRVRRADLTTAEKTADRNSKAFDAATKPITTAIDRLAALVSSQARLVQTAQTELQDADLSQLPNATAATLQANLRKLDGQSKFLASAFAAARLRFDARRYKEEARLNMAIAQLFEVEVRRSSGESDRNRIRSKDFFYGMLAAQAAVTIATFSLAVKQRSLLWSLASAAGLIAIALGVYVYLAV